MSAERRKGSEGKRKVKERSDRRGTPLSKCIVWPYGLRELLAKRMRGKPEI